MVRIVILMLLTACTPISHNKPKFGKPTTAPQGYEIYKNQETYKP